MENPTTRPSADDVMNDLQDYAADLGENLDDVVARSNDANPVNEDEHADEPLPAAGD